MEEQCGCALCSPGLYGADPEARQLVGDYPSQREPSHFAPEHVLLDTCVVQNLAWARRSAPALSDDDGWRQVDERFGATLGRELRAVAGLLPAVEATLDVEDVTCPFVVGRASWQELCRLTGPRGAYLRAEWRLWRSRIQRFDFETGAVPDERLTAMPEELGWPDVGWSSFPGLDDGYGHAESMGPFRDVGDRLLIAEARTLGQWAILTTDFRTFWRYRGWLYEHGLEVWRPSDFCWALCSATLLFRDPATVVPAWPPAVDVVARDEAACAPGANV